MKGGRGCRAVTTEQAIRIYKMLHNGCPTKYIQEEYKISTCLMYNIKYGKGYWAHIKALVEMNH